MRDLRALVLAAASIVASASLHAQTPLQFVSSPLPNVPFPVATDSAFGDLDGDGDRDLALIAATGPKVYRNDGSGVFTDVTAVMPPLAGNMRTAVFVDVDGDQRRELLLTWDALPRLFRMLPDGSWVELSSAFPPALPTIHGAVAVDIDNDGDEDLACAGHWLSGGQNQLLTNDGLGVFTASQPFPGTSFQMLAADVDQDGDADLFASRDGLALWRNDGNGAFTDVSAVQLPAGLGSPSAMDLGDVDGDGLVDLVLGRSAIGDVLLPNVGGGVFGL
ncbi:MAG: VCBS repeat-containing protein, partial [Planctomycetota bacterium]